MGKVQDKLEWFGEKGSAGKDTVKLAGQAIVGVTAVVIAGAVLGTVGNMWSK
jgi:hypothetical protein